MTTKQITNWGDSIVAIDPKTMLYRSVSGKPLSESMLTGSRIAGRKLKVPTISAQNPTEVVTVMSINIDPTTEMAHATVVDANGHARHFRVVEEK